MTPELTGFYSGHGHLEESERTTHRLVLAHHRSDVEQTRSSEGVFGLPVQPVIDAVKGRQVARETRCDLLLIAQILGDTAIGKPRDRHLGQAGFARQRT